MAALTGIPFEHGLELLVRQANEIWFRARSMYPCAGFERLLPNWRFSSTLDAGSVPPLADANRVAFGAQMDEHLQTWATQNGLRLAMPSIELTLRLGDKLALPKIAIAAGVATARSIRVPAASRGSRAEAATLLERLSTDRVVVQLRENDLTGGGTRYVENAADLEVHLAEWADHEVKVTEYISGMPLTASGSVIGNNVAVSGVAYQIVGHDRLTPVWGAHCGNQLVDDDDLPHDTARRCRETVRRLGAALAKVGFRGMFGADLVGTSENVRVIEINPRITGVTSLLNLIELAGGMMPAPGVHLLSFLANEGVPVAEFTVPVLPFGQLIVCAQAAGTIRTVPASGTWALYGDRAHRVGSLRSLTRLSPGEALVWPLTVVGMPVAAGGRLYVLQLPNRVIDIDSHPAITDLAWRWLTALDCHSDIGHR